MQASQGLLAVAPFPGDPQKTQAISPNIFLKEILGERGGLLNSVPVWQFQTRKSKRRV
jgi:hypothetical protein